jgi:hypothetical protein
MNNVVVSAEEVKHITHKIMNKVLKSDIDDWELCVDDLKTINIIAQTMDDSLRAFIALTSK